MDNCLGIGRVTLPPIMLIRIVQTREGESSGFVGCGDLSSFLKLMTSKWKMIKDGHSRLIYYAYLIKKYLIKKSNCFHIYIF